MTNDEIAAKLKELTAEIDMLRARNDALSISLKYAILSAGAPGKTLDLIVSRLRDTADHALFSDQPSDAYLTAFDASIQTVQKWLQSQQRAAP